MNLTSRTIFLISADSQVAQGCIDELSTFGGRYRTPTANSIFGARKNLKETLPAVIFLDQSAIDATHDGESMESVVSLLTEIAPVVVAAAPERQSDLAFLITAGAVDFVARMSNFIPIAVGMLERRVRIAERISGIIQFPIGEIAGDFGEI
jgi:hypothetical protein